MNNPIWSGLVRALFLSVSLLLAAGSAGAGVVHLKNGDRISGVITQIYDSEVTIEPDYADEFTVDVSAIDFIESERDFEMKLSLSDDADFKFLGEGEDGIQKVEIDGQAQTVNLTELEEVTEPEEFYDWNASFDVSLNITRGNTDTDNNKLAGAAGFKHGNNRHIAGLQILRERTDGSSTKRQDLANYEYNWLFDRPWFVGATVDYERDPIKDLDYRYNLGLNLGRDIWDSAGRFWSIQAGPGAQFEDRGDNSESQATVQARNRMAADIPGVKDLSVFFNQRVTHNVTGEDNTVLKTSSGMEMEFLDDWYVKLSYDWDWESDPSDDSEKADSTLLFGLGKEFD
ncbi:MAG: DUF481 domain-containing protein [Gammaproteobacteria bacterium]|jgi:putative salt-induced outer membrane protein YdiY|nr:DUF481 domain-containing protein [Gammaproteobacteria bacterium]